MNQHIRGFHGEKTLKCDICDATFTQKSNLNNHKASVHEKKKVFICDIHMWYYFHLKNNLNQHIRGVHGEATFKCDICDTALTQKISLNNHIQNHVHEEKKCKF